MIQLDKLIEFAQSISYSISSVSYKEYTIYPKEYRTTIYLSVNIDFDLVTLRFFPEEQKMDKRMLSSLTRKINSEFILERKVRERSPYDIGWRSMEYKFFIHRLEDLKKVIDIMDQYLLINKLSS